MGCEILVLKPISGGRMNDTPAGHQPRIIWGYILNLEGKEELVLMQLVRCCSELWIITENPSGHK